MSKKQERMCAVRIDYRDLILPMADGLKLVDIASRAIPAERIYGSGKKKFAVKEQPDHLSVEVLLVHPDEVELLAAPKGLLNSPKGGAA